MNINLFMGLNIRKSNSLPVPDAQISKLVKNGVPAYDKFKEIMRDIKKHDLAENDESTKTAAFEHKVEKRNDFTSAEKAADMAAEKNEIQENMKLKNAENKRISMKQLKKIDEKLCEFVSFLILVNSPDWQKLDDLTIGIKDGQAIAACGDKEIVINASFFDSLAANITANLNQLMNGITAYFENGSAVESGGLQGDMTLKDALTKAIFDALNKTSAEQEMPGDPTDKTDAALRQALANAEQLNTEIANIALTEEPGLESSLQEIQSGSGGVIEVGELTGQTPERPAVAIAPLTDVTKNSNVKKDGRIVSLEQALGRLFKQLGISEDLIDSKIESIISSLKPDSEELELGKKTFLNLAKKIIVELSQLSKKFTLHLEELIAKLETGATGKFELNSHLVKSLRNSEAFELYTDKFLKPFVFQANLEPGIGASGTVSTNPVTVNTAVNLADVIMQISSRIVSKDSSVIGQLEIMLKPESLGTIRIKVETSGDGVNIKILTQYSHTEEIISSNLDMLKNNLSEKGVLLKDLSVFMDLNTGTNGKSFEGFSGFGDALNQSNSPKQHPEEDPFAKNRTFEDSNEAGETENTEIDALSNDYNDTYGVDIVA